ncbi:MAG: hypothetical protein F6K39_39575 [Okeania sp. SIO3B3]|nr:hypothetical protein [Okeania sp. SIO3B3]
MKIFLFILLKEEAFNHNFSVTNVPQEVKVGQINYVDLEEISITQESYQNN